MAEKICPFMESPSSESMVTCKDGKPYGDGYFCQAWSEKLGDCKMFPVTAVRAWELSEQRLAEKQVNR